jgi:hypothetical protein
MSDARWTYKGQGQGRKMLQQLRNQLRTTPRTRSETNRRLQIQATYRSVGDGLVGQVKHLGGHVRHLPEGRGGFVGTRNVGGGQRSGCCGPDPVVGCPPRCRLNPSSRLSRCDDAVSYVMALRYGSPRCSANPTTISCQEAMGNTHRANLRVDRHQHRLPQPRQPKVLRVRHSTTYDKVRRASVNSCEKTPSPAPWGLWVFRDVGLGAYDIPFRTHRQLGERRLALGVRDQHIGGLEVCAARAPWGQRGAEARGRRLGH